MTKIEFEILCNEYLIAPEIVLENEDVVDALRNRDDDKVKELLENEF